MRAQACLRAYAALVRMHNFANWFLDRTNGFANITHTFPDDFFAGAKCAAKTGAAPVTDNAKTDRVCRKRLLSVSFRSRLPARSKRDNEINDAARYILPVS